LRGPTGFQGPTGNQGPVGTVGPAPDWQLQGNWSSNVAVVVGDIYVYQGESWYANNSGLIGTPSNNSDWTRLVQKGGTGPTGPAGREIGNYYTASFTRSTTPLTDGPTIPISLTSSNSAIFTVTLGGNRTLQNPTFLPTGTDVKYFSIIVTQDATGGRTLGYDTLYNIGDVDTDLNYGSNSRSHLYFMASDNLIELLGKRI
jgi:hypothetical protein